MAARKKGRLWLWISLVVLVILVGAGVGIAHLASGSGIDPNKIAKVSKGDVARSVVATGKSRRLPRSR